MSTKHACAECGVSGVQIYRPWGVALDAANLRCNAHVPAEERNPLGAIPVLVSGAKWSDLTTDEKMAALLPDADPDGPHIQIVDDADGRRTAWVPGDSHFSMQALFKMSEHSQPVTRAQMRVSPDAEGETL